MRVTIEQKISADLIESFYELYVAAFGPLRTRAAARQVLSLDEFIEEMTDPRVDKYVVWNADDDGVEQAIALTTFTNDLATVPWIEPAYYEHHYPDHFARNAVYYFDALYREALPGVLEALAEELARLGYELPVPASSRVTSPPSSSVAISTPGRATSSPAVRRRSCSESRMFLLNSTTPPSPRSTHSKSSSEASSPSNPGSRQAAARSGVIRGRRRR